MEDDPYLPDLWENRLTRLHPEWSARSVCALAVYIGFVLRTPLASTGPVTPRRAAELLGLLAVASAWPLPPVCLPWHRGAPWISDNM